MVKHPRVESGGERAQQCHPLKPQPILMSPVPDHLPSCHVPQLQPCPLSPDEGDQGGWWELPCVTWLRAGGFGVEGWGGVTATG